MAQVMIVRNGGKLLDIATTDMGDGTAKLQVDVDMATEGIATSANQITEITALQSIDGKLPAAAAAADASANATTVSSILGRVAAFNGTTWDRIRAGVTSLGTTVTGYLNVLPSAIYNAAPTARTEGQFGPLQADASGSLRQTLATLIAGEDLTNNVLAVAQQPLATNTHAPTVVTAINATNAVGKAAAGNLYAVYGYNGNAATRYIHIFNATALPANGTAPTLAPIAVPTGQTFSLDLAGYGIYFSTGIVVATSTTLATLTAGSADMSATVVVG